MFNESRSGSVREGSRASATQPVAGWGVNQEWLKKGLDAIGRMDRNAKDVEWLSRRLEFFVRTR